MRTAPSASPLALAHMSLAHDRFLEMRAALEVTRRGLPIGPAQIEVARLLDQLEEMADTFGEVRDLMAGG